MKEPSNKNFEGTIADLESMIGTIENGDANIEESLKAFEKGIKLVHTAQSYLTQAEQRIASLTEEDGKLITKDFHENGE